MALDITKTERDHNNHMQCPTTASGQSRHNDIPTGKAQMTPYQNFIDARNIPAAGFQVAVRRGYGFD